MQVRKEGCGVAPRRKGGSIVGRKGSPAPLFQPDDACNTGFKVNSRRGRRGCMRWVRPAWASNSSLVSYGRKGERRAERPDGNREII